MKKLGFTAIAVLMLLSLTFGLAACGSGGLVGTWELQLHDGSFGDHRIEFFPDGNFVTQWHVAHNNQ